MISIQETEAELVGWGGCCAVAFLFLDCSGAVSGLQAKSTVGEGSRGEIEAELPERPRDPRPSRGRADGGGVGGAGASRGRAGSADRGAAREVAGPSFSSSPTPVPSALELPYLSWVVTGGS